MLIAVISDVHGNVEALRGVLRSIRRDGIRKIFCLGDLVGHHAFPAETLTLIRAGGTDCVAGNHDLMIIGRMALEMGDLRARRAIHWTRRKLTGPDLNFLGALPQERAQEDLLFVHSTLDDPALAMETPWQFYEESKVIRHRHPEVRICFSGHTHEQQIMEITPDGEALIRGARQYVLRKDSFFFVNPGSVGLPGGTDYRAAYVVFDTATRRVSFRRTTYDRLRVMQENIRHGLSSELGISPVGYLRARAAAAARSLRTRIMTGMS
jgi:predicted phosphodiesterase